MRIALEFDDFSPKNTNFGLLEELREHFPKFKVTMFTVPYEIRWGEPSPITEERWSPFVLACRRSFEWLEIALHGLTHLPGEFKHLGYEDAKKRIVVGEKMFLNRQIRLAKIFKAPGWELSEKGKNAAEDLGYKVVEDHYYHWNLKDEFPPGVDDDTEIVGDIVAHGHVQQTMGNGLEEVFPRIMRLPADTDFMFLSEYLKADIIDPANINFDPMKK